MKRNVFVLGVLMVSALFFSAGALLLTFEKPAFPVEKRTELVMRDIAHNLMLQTGDDTTRVLPVKKISSETYQLEFQHTFSFVPDSLMSLVQQHLKAAQLPQQYMVTVQDCQTSDIVYGYEMAPEINNILACKGRIQPEGCYTIQVTFTEPHTLFSAIHTNYLLLNLLGLAIVACLGFVYFRPEKKHEPAVNASKVAIGNYDYYIDDRVLKNEHETIELSDKESKLLHIFAFQQNQPIERDYLLKEVWENEGVIVGRSLDVFISRLRKKLQNDPSVRLSNIHGKGYKLETNLD